MGKDGETIRRLRRICDCDIQVSPWGSFHPAATNSQGRIVQCSAATRGSLCNTLTKILETLFTHDGGLAHLKFIFPMGLALGGVHLAELQATLGVTLHLLPAAPTLTDEQFLECKGTTAALSHLLPNLFASLPFPLHYRYGTLSLPPVDTVSASSQPWKHNREDEHDVPMATKRCKHPTWRANHGRGSRGRTSHGHY